MLQLHSPCLFLDQQCCILDKEIFINNVITVCISILLIISALKQPLGDAYGLLMHRNGQWEWTLAPGVSPSSRYQHAAVSDLYKS